MIRGIITIHNPYLASHAQDILARSKNIIQKDTRGISWLHTENHYAFGYLHSPDEHDVAKYNDMDPNLICTFWGDIYNKSDLQQQLDLKTSHPTDIIKAGYRKWGLNFPEKIEGKFVFTLLDKEREELIIARDKMGLLPLYFYSNSQTQNIIISSEIKYILNFMDNESEVNSDAVFEYFTFRFIGGENTLFKGIKECMPGHLYRFNISGNLTRRSYWEPRYNDHHLTISLDEASELIERYLFKAVAQRVSPKSRTGALVSGGIDSSYGAVLLSQVMQKSFHTIFISFEDYDYNYSKYAAYVSSLIKSNHHELIMNNEEYTKLFPHTIWINDEPLNHPASVARCYLNHVAPQLVDDLFTGEGVDSIFGGARALILLPLVFANKTIPSFFKKMLKVMPLSFFPADKRHIAQKIIDSLTMPPDEFCIVGEAFVDPNKVKRFLTLPPPTPLFDHYYQIFDNYSKKNIIEKLFYFYQRPFLMEIFDMEAKMGAVGGINYKYPFLASEIVDLANKIPLAYKKRGIQGKYIIKKTVERYFSKQFIYRRKEGFGVPLEKWFLNNSHMGKYIDMLLEPKTLQRGFFSENYLKKMVNDLRHHTLPIGEYEGLLWTAINFELWNRIFIDR